MKTLALLFLATSLACVQAADKKAPEPLSSEEKLSLRDLQVENLQSANQMAALEKRYAELQGAQQRNVALFTEAVKKLFDKRKLDPKDWQITPTFEFKAVEPAKKEDKK